MKRIKKIVLLLVIVSVFLMHGGVLHATQAQKTTDGSKAVKININTAGTAQLIQLPRVGEKIAQRIIDFRKKNGNFKRIQDIMKVRGIGLKTYKKFEKMITV